MKSPIEFKCCNLLIFSGLILALTIGSKIIGYAQESEDLTYYTPEWIKDGFANAGATHEPWIFQTRRNRPDFNQWQYEQFEYQISEEYIKALAESGITIYHVGCYKGFGFNAEKEYMDQVAKAAAIAHKYGMKVDTYIQWNTMAYETFFSEVPEAETGKWYQMDFNGTPLLLTYGYQQSFRYRPCFNHDDYINYLKEKILRYAVEVVKTDFIHFDNFDYNFPPEADFNPKTVEAFRQYLSTKYSPEKRIERFGFEDISHIQPPLWNSSNPAEKMTNINDPVIQEWIDFRCRTMTSRLRECSQFVRELNKEVAIEINPHGLLGSNRMWEAGIDHGDIMQYTNVIWTEDANNPRWENGVAIGKFRHFKLGRTTGNYIMTGNHKANDFAESLAFNRNIGSLGKSVPDGIRKKYLDFWLEHKDLYTNMIGGEKVAILRTYPSMAYNTYDTQISVNMAEQALQQNQIPFDIIFDQQIDEISKYYTLVLANQESLSDEWIEALKKFVTEGGGLVITGNTGLYDSWRRIRKQSLMEIFSGFDFDYRSAVSKSFSFGKGKIFYISKLEVPDVEILLGFESTWFLPENTDELISAVKKAGKEELPLQLDAPEWVGVSHDIQDSREIIHLVNYHKNSVAGIKIRYLGKIKNAYAISPDQDGKTNLTVERNEGISTIFVPGLDVYEIVVIEK